MAPAIGIAGTVTGECIQYFQIKIQTNCVKGWLQASLDFLNPILIQSSKGFEARS